MSRLRRIEQAHRFFFLTTNLARGCRPLSPSERTLVLQDLRSIRATHDFLIFSFVIMPDHVHLLCYPRESLLRETLRDFKSRSAPTLRKNRANHGSIWQPRFFDAIWRKVTDFWEKRDYIHQNPVRAGLVGRAVDWPWSSAARNPGAFSGDPIDLSRWQCAALWRAP
jgi:putative transposase